MSKHTQRPMEKVYEEQGAEYRRLKEINTALLEALKDMKERWDLVVPLFNGIEFCGVSPEVSAKIAEEVIRKAEAR